METTWLGINRMGGKHMFFFNNLLLKMAIINMAMGAQFQYLALLPLLCVGYKRQT